ncbi:MAG: hypothetical protein GEU28_03025 [Dehalococcoidia bacterium]|nr:hypothetical protein [Dehalococcoidia bacterium]
MTSVVVGGPLANKAYNGGIAWNVISYVLGLKKLGFRVYLVEEMAAENCVDRNGSIVSFDASENLAYFHAITEAFGLSDAALLYDGGAQVYGSSPDELRMRAEEAALLINISGHLALGWVFGRIPCKVYIDEDPGFTQFWQASGDSGIHLVGHDFYYTVGENVGEPGCSVPTNGIPWRPIRQPVVLDEWPVAPSPRPPRFTTVASWRGPYGQVEYEGQRFGLKVHEFRKFVALPERTSFSFEIALDIHPDDHRDLALLRNHGWRVIEPGTVAGDPQGYRRYVQGSGAEFSVAQGIYVDTGSGWFSDRSARYLASGKPVLLQDTGFSRNLPTGQGLLAFCDLDDAVAGTERIASDYDQHSRAARALAEEYFDSDKVLGRLLEAVGVSP